jgi:hypothetical protein
MQIDYVSRNFELDDRLRDYAASKFQKLSRFLDEPLDVTSSKSRRAARARSTRTSDVAPTGRTASTGRSMSWIAAASARPRRASSRAAP